MKDLMIDWVESHKGKRENGRWFIYDCDWLGEKEFETEKELGEFLWNYIVDNPDCYIPHYGL